MLEGRGAAVGTGYRAGPETPFQRFADQLALVLVVFNDEKSQTFHVFLHSFIAPMCAAQCAGSEVRYNCFVGNPRSALGLGKFDMTRSPQLPPRHARHLLPDSPRARIS